jgi:succinoglycan biosynthesis protein ExoM
MEAVGASGHPGSGPTDSARTRSGGRGGVLRVAICVASYRRPEGLARLLRALERLEFAGPEPSRLVVVVDNDPAGSAEAVCEAARPGCPLRYVVEPRRGIPRARNAALDAASGEVDWLAFLDDDEEPAADWLEVLLRTQRATGADVVTGPVLRRFESPPPDWVVKGRFFEPLRYPDGARVDRAFTGNVLVRSALLRSPDVRFDEHLRAGEDAAFFESLAKRGATIVWSNRAIVHEHVPRSRMRAGWIVRRGAQVGTARTRIESARGIRAVPRAVLHGCWCLARGAAGALANACLGRTHATVSSLRLLAYGAGRLSGLVRRPLPN